MEPLALLTGWGVALVFGATLVEQGGLPLPAAPLLVAAGALAEQGAMRPAAVLLAALLACLLADHFWFLTGRRYGRRLLSGICRLSLSPDSCVSRTDGLIARHGAPLLLVAKFIPGVSAVAIPTAAAMGLPYRRFLVFDGLGSLMWCGAYVGVGMVFSREVNRVIEAMGAIGGWSLLALSALFALYLAGKLAHRRRLRNLYRLVRITPAEVAGLLADGEDLLLLDARSELALQADPRVLPRSIRADDRLALNRLPGDARDRTLVTFCTCPNEASAALLADRLIRAGFSRVRVLSGGTQALEVLATPTPAK